MFEVSVVLANTMFLKVEVKLDATTQLEVLGCKLLVINFDFTLLNSHKPLLSFVYKMLPHICVR